MNQSIRCEPLSFPISERAAGEAALCPIGPEKPFDEVLGGQLEDDPEEQPKTEKKPGEKESVAVETYGVTSAVLQIPALLLPIVGNFSEAASTESALPEGQGLAPGTEVESGSQEIPIPGPDATGEIEPEPPGDAKAAKAAFVDQLKAVPPERLEQKLPSRLPPPVSGLEKSALQGVKAAEMSRGTVVAQRAAMLMTNSKQEESSSRAELGLEQFETVAFEAPVRTNPVSRIEAPKRDQDPVVFNADGFEFESQPLDVISEEIELQPARPVESTSMIESIRTNVELLKSSNQERLEVVLRPDAQTELHIRVEKVNGQIQVHARCDRGDFALLETHWSGIQQGLSGQGVRVEPLQQGSAGNFNNPSHQFQNPENHSGSRGQHSSERGEAQRIFVEQNFSQMKPTQQKETRAAGARGWQSWA